MDAKEIKNALKEARDSIKNKNFNASLKLCKSILKSDRENYMALVFMGLSLQEVGPREQAVHAFRKASIISPDQALAWHGMANFYEKDDTIDSRKELMNTYEKLLNLESDHTKFSDLCCKYVNVAVYLQEVGRTSETLKLLTENEKYSEQHRRTIWLALASLFTQIKDLAPEFLPLFETTLHTVLKESTSVTCDYYKEYLKVLYKLKKYSELVKEALNMSALYENNAYPVEWVCKVYVEMVIEENSVVSEFEDQVEKCYSKLIELQTDSVMGIFTKGVIAYKNNDFLNARDILKEVVSIRAGLVHAWVLLSECSLILHGYNDAVQAATRADKILQIVSKEKLQSKLNRILISALSYHSDEDKWRQAIELGKKVENHDDGILAALINAHINLDDFAEAERLIKGLSKPVLMQAKLSHKKGELKEALELLVDNSIESCEAFTEIGKLYWELQEYEKCLVPFLKAAKLDPNSFECFVYLGQYYEHYKDIEKARRCYQKAHKINPRCSAVGIGLSNIYRQQKNWDANFALLYSVTGKDKAEDGGLPVINKNVRWAWLQLGLHYLEQGDSSSAIDSLRSVIRVEPNNSYYWECLADAYMARGSYTSAMKSYERAAELTEDNLYARLQVASVKLLIGHFDEAKIEFAEILETNKKYVPALKGMGETCLNLAIVYKKEQLLGLARTNAQLALDNLTTALKERGDLSCLWKLTADSCFLVATLPEKYSDMIVHSVLTENSHKDDYEIFSRDQLFTLVSRCYCKAISLSPTNIMLWHDLATCYYKHGCFSEDSSESFTMLERALATAKYCAKNDPGCWTHWNFIGVIATHKMLKDYALAQHAFIRSVTIEPNSAISWSNLGALYHLLGDLKLANRAYSQAQRSDATYGNSWVGQAMIAETMGHEDAMDLFRHSSQLGYSDQGALNYASWVCKTITESQKNVELYSIKNMHAIPVAHDAMVWYTENNPNDPCAWNMLGILSERLGLKTTALKAFKKSLSLLPPDDRDKILVNYGRKLTDLGEYEKAIDAFRDIKEASFNGGCGLALALFKAEQYEDSYDSYDSTMQWLAEDETLQSHVLVALASMAYMFQGPESAKNLLFQSTQLQPPSRWGLFAILSLGILHGEISVAKLVLKELESIKDDPDVIYHNAILDAYTYIMQGDKKKSIRCLSKYIHRHPNQGSLWLSFALLLLNTDSKNMGSIAAKCAEVSMSLGRTQQNMDVTKIWSIVAYASLLSKDITKSIKTAQKAIHCYPNIAEGWAVLATALNFCKYIEETWSKKREWIESTLLFIVRKMSPSDDLSEWLSALRVR